MGYFSDLDIAIKEAGLCYDYPRPKTGHAERYPILIEHRTPEQIAHGYAPTRTRTRITPGGTRVLLWPGCWVQAGWLRLQANWQRVAGWRAEVRVIDWPSS